MDGERMGEMQADTLEGQDRDLGPILYFRAHRGATVALHALIVRPQGRGPGTLSTALGDTAPQRIAARSGHEVFRYAFDLPARADAWYEVEGTRYAVDADYTGDLRLAYVSCNGQETGDLERPDRERNEMWRRLGRQHGDAPFHLLLQGGDQLYADEVTKAHPASRGWPEGAGALDAQTARELGDALRDAFFYRYVTLLDQDSVSWICARVPGLAMWDDHDICDGWGSLPPSTLDSDVGRALFEAARESFLLFQLGEAPDGVPSFCLDPGGASLGWSVDLPGLRILAPDLRSERRPGTVMGPVGWRGTETALTGAPAGRTLVMSSVPALGPRLSLVEWLMGLTSRMEDYEDDLRDQWQSRTHRAEWTRFLRALADLHQRGDAGVTVVSGEIHLATRGELDTAAGPLHQLVASGITHPPPLRAYALALGALAKLGSSPLPRMPIAMRPLPGKRTIYCTQRNYLRLEREDGAWRAIWQLEESGATPALPL